MLQYEYTPPSAIPKILRSLPRCVIITKQKGAGETWIRNTSQSPTGISPKRAECLNSDRGDARNRLPRSVMTFELKDGEIKCSTMSRVAGLSTHSAANSQDTRIHC